MLLVFSVSFILSGAVLFLIRDSPVASQYYWKEYGGTVIGCVYSEHVSCRVQ